MPAVGAAVERVDVDRLDADVLGPPHVGQERVADVDRRMTFAYVMNKMAPGIVGPSAAALLERLYDLVTR